jgi:hypothetical protein
MEFAHNMNASISWQLLPSQAILLRDELRWMADGSDEWSSRSPYGLVKVLKQLDEFSSLLIESGYCHEAAESISDFVKGSSEINELLRRAQKEEALERKLPHKPFSLSFSAELKAGARKIVEHYKPEYGKHGERNGVANTRTREDYEKEVAKRSLMQNLHESAAICAIIASSPSVFGSGIEAEYSLESVLYRNSAALAKAGYPELREWVKKSRPELEEALALAHKAARKERRAGKQR